MKYHQILKRIQADKRGSALIEFAILAPALIGMMLGIMFIGLQVMSYNSLRSISSDVARYTLVEYQKTAFKPGVTEIREQALAIALNPPYSFDDDDLSIAVTKPNSDISGTEKFTATITYTPYNPVEFMGVPGPTMVETRSIYVPD